MAYTVSSALKINESTDIYNYINQKIETRMILNHTKKISYFKDHVLTMPDCIKTALEVIYQDYNEKFQQLIKLNVDNSVDYSYNKNKLGKNVNWIVQIDLKGMDDKFIQDCKNSSQETVNNFVKSRIFEIENSWAAYLVHASATSTNRLSKYSQLSSQILSEIRHNTDKKIILLAPTDEKYLSMIHSEFGLDRANSISSDIVYQFTGFDDFWGPREFIHHAENIKDIEEYLFYVRASDPLRKLRDPLEMVVHPLFSVEKYFNIIKRQSLTHNIDHVSWPITDCRKINDTKMYMPDMGLADHLQSVEQIKLLQEKYGDIRLRAKPAVGSYGCYGHLSGHLKDKKFRYKLKNGLTEWGSFVIQPEYPPSIAINQQNNGQYAFMDRIFCGFINQKETYLGGQRIYIPTDSFEVKKRRLHLVNESIFSEIY